ncbi:SrfA family protein [Variovorax rhizosphaerae]|uniref:SrfA family protein n=1 Tax=Variovorax rhizosphaerae TaxID=1836200 RepID=A0ABU8WRJ5_9BURK
MNTPAFGATGSQLAQDRVDRYRSLGVFGKPAYQSHVQLRAMLKSKRGDRVANYFAKPTYNPDLGELRWTAEVPGTVRSWHDMSAQDQAQGALELEVIRAGLMSFAQELRTQSGGQPGGAASFASLLEQAIRVPKDGQFLYFVGDQPMIAFWGFEDQNGHSVDPLSLAPRSNAVAAPPVGAPPPPSNAVPIAVTVEEKRRSWKWLLWLLLGLLLLALLLFFGLRGCTPKVALVPPDLSTTAKPPDGVTPQTPVPTQPPVDSTVVPAVPPVVGGPTTEVPGTDSKAPADTVPAVPDTTAALPDGKKDPLAPIDTKTLPKDVPPDEKANLPDPKTDAGTKNDPNAKAVPPPPVTPPSPDKGKPLAMPDDPGAAKKLGFLEGDWKAGDGLADKVTKQPLDLSFKFSKDGTGQVMLRKPDGTTCQGPVQGRMDGGKLGIQGNQVVPCSDGGRYGAPKIECSKSSGGQTQCFGINPDGSKYFMGMQRQ